MRPDRALRNGSVLAVEGSRVFFFDMRGDGKPGLFCFDAATGKREKVAETPEPRWWAGGAVSPDGMRRIVREWKGGPVKVGAYKQGFEIPEQLSADVRSGAETDGVVIRLVTRTTPEPGLTEDD